MHSRGQGSQRKGAKYTGIHPQHHSMEDEGPAALGYKGECHPTMGEYQPLGVSGHLSEGEANCAPALEGYQPMGLVGAEAESSSEDLLSRAEPDTAVQYRPLEDEEEELLEEGNSEGGGAEVEVGGTEREGGGMEVEGGEKERESRGIEKEGRGTEREGRGMEGAGTEDGSADFRIASQDSSMSEPSSEGEGEGEEEGRTETGYMLLCQDEPDLNEEEEGEEKGEEAMEGKLELQDYQPVGGLPPRMSKWLQKQVAELEGGSSQPRDTDWAKFDESSKATDSHDWPGSSGSGCSSSPQRPQRRVREEHVEPVNKMEEGTAFVLVCCRV